VSVARKFDVRVQPVVARVDMVRRARMPVPRSARSMNSRRETGAVGHALVVERLDLHVSAVTSMAPIRWPCRALRATAEAAS